MCLFDLHMCVYEHLVHNDFVMTFYLLILMDQVSSFLLTLTIVPCRIWILLLVFVGYSHFNFFFNFWCKLNRT
jgi:hypothetical protein